MTVCEEVLRERQVEGEEDGGEVQGVEPVRGGSVREIMDRNEEVKDAPDNVLADDLQVGRPQFALLERLAASPRVARRRQVVDQGVDPDIDRVLRVAGDRDAPREA